MSTIPAFDIFSGRFGDKDVVWLGAIEGLAEARRRMLRFAAEQPAFAFARSGHVVSLV